MAEAALTMTQQAMAVTVTLTVAQENRSGMLYACCHCCLRDLSTRPCSNFFNMKLEKEMAPPVDEFVNWPLAA
jgi:hypothetical protein